MSMKQRIEIHPYTAIMLWKVTQSNCLFPGAADRNCNNGNLEVKASSLSLYRLQCNYKHHTFLMCENELFRAK